MSLTFAGTPRQWHRNSSKYNIKKPVTEDSAALPNIRHLGKIDTAPHSPGKQTGKIVAIHAGYPGIPPDKGEFAHGGIAKGFGSVSAKASDNILCHQLAFAGSILCRGRVRSLAGWIGDLRAVT